ncbi:glycoside hydrolase family 5 protein [Schizophyllum commune]
MEYPSDSEASFVLVGDNKSPSKAQQTSPLAGAPPDEKYAEHPSLAADYTPGSTSSYAHDWSLNHDHDIFPAEHHSATFVGRPFPLSVAHEHLSRLRRWGLTFVRFLVTWEAVEHAGPGQYDVEYLDYVRALLSMLPQYGLAAFVSMHQDVWSRYSGGSGAPAWTVDAVGFDLHALEETGAAFLRGVVGGGHIEDERGIWPCGYQKLAAATMSTVFWAGDTFAPKLKITDAQIPVQEFLQSAFLNMFERVVRAVGDLEAVIGFEVMNEPHRGYIDLKSLHSFDYNTDLHLSYVPTAFQSFQLGAGRPTEVAHWTRSFPFPTRKTGSAVLNVDKRKVWREDGPTGGHCLWEMHGVWGWDVKKDSAVVLRENYFSKHPLTGKPVDWYTDFYYPFLQRWASRVHAAAPNKFLFVEPIPNEFCPPSWRGNQVPNMVYAPHWYDLNTLFSGEFGDFTVNVQGLSRGMFLPRALYWGQGGARDNYAVQIRNIVNAGHSSLGERPVLIGECGIPMNLNKGEAFKTDDYTWQLRAMDALVTALDRALVGFTLWNYNPLNDDRTGDDWNGENFSWFSQRRALPPSLLFDDPNHPGPIPQESPMLDNGGRILPAIVRPYPAKTAGVPLRFRYEVTEGECEFEWASSPGVGEKASVGSSGDPAQYPPAPSQPPVLSRETELFLPSQLTQGRRVRVSGLEEGDRYVHDQARQTLFIVTARNEPGTLHRVRVAVDPPPRPAFEANDFWSDFGGHVTMVAMALLAILLFFVMRSWQ